jgi:Tfp pilus assembly protein PilN
MVVKLDLSIPGKQQLDLEVQNSLKHYLVFAAAALFFITFIAVLLLSAWKFFSLYSEKDVALKKLDANNQNLTLMSKEFQRIEEQTSGINSTADFMLGDVPSIEVLTVLDSLLPDDVALSSVTISNNSATFKGLARKDESIMNFVNRLTASSFASAVDVPEITKGDSNLRAFSVSCVLKPLQQVIQSGSFSNPDTNSADVPVNGGAVQ